MDGFPYIDHRIEHVGVSKLRLLNHGALEDLRTVLVISGRDDQPLAVMLSYEHYMGIQKMLVDAGILLPYGSQ